MISTLRAPTSARPRLTTSSSVPIEAARPSDRSGNVLSSLKALNRLLKLQPAALAALVCTRVIDSRGREVRQHNRDGLVFLGELHRVLLVGEVEVAPDLTADLDRDDQENSSSADDQQGTRSSADAIRLSSDGEDAAP